MNKKLISIVLIVFALSQCLILPAYAQKITATIQVDSAGKPISGDLFGIFFEDLNYAADGGLYPERVQNRSFEYSRGDNRNWNSLSFWQLLQNEKGAVSVSVETTAPLNANNPHYAVLTVKTKGDRNGLINEGFDGIVLAKGDKYNVSLFARVFSGNPGAIIVRVENPQGQSLGEVQLEGLKSQWTKHTAVIESKANETNARLVVLVSGTGKLALDMVSLFPQKTFRNRPNGLRADLAQVVADLKPKFVRFPGGCLAHGDGLENMYRWKETIGPMEQRKAQRNIWRYHQTLGLGYFEYFQFCQDIGAEPLPVVPAGVCCQNSGNYLNLVPRGQQGIEMDQMDEYVQEVLDLIEWANGPADSKWGAKRAQAGHPEPFNLKYIGVGNEDAITPVFRERFKMIYDAVKEKHPEITVIGTTGPGHSGRDFDQGWKFANELNLEMVDEHYYVSPGWFWANLDRYDSYDRDKSKVYLGEYAAHDSERRTTLRSALAEAAYMTGLERNGDIVRFASYAPLLGKLGHTQWNPDLIYFNNTKVFPTINYYVQQMFSLNAGDVYLPTEVKIEKLQAKKIGNGVLLGTWNTQAKFDNVKVTNGAGAVVDESFDDPAEDWETLSGQWQQSDGAYSQSSGQMPALSMRAFADDRSAYTVTLKAMKISGAEGFLIGFGALDRENFYWLNIGGWGNTTHRLEKSIDDVRSYFGPSVPGNVESNRWYDIKIQVTGKQIQCYLDGDLIIDITDDRGLAKGPDLSASTVRDTATGDIIVKIVSKSDESVKTAIDLSSLGTFESEAACAVLSGDPMAVNDAENPKTVVPQTSRVKVAPVFDYEAPPHSLTVIRIKTN
ncbi:MAG: carbohydrate binding domain-containing protein [Sedimentisphaerales bacterium]|nr:carbohydrate binding domain-containing protein [Sedimentisphaerales bacterium]